MLFDISIDTNADRVALRLTPEGETFGAGSYLNTTPTKKARRNHPLSLLFLTLWVAAELDAILREKALPQSS